MYQGVRVSNSSFMGVCCDARCVGREHFETAEGIFKLLRCHATDGAFGGLAFDRRNGAVLGSMLVNMEPTQLCSVWREAEGPD